MLQKGLAPILIILLLAAAVGGYFIYQKQVKPVLVQQIAVQPSPSPISQDKKPDSIGANWKSYNGVESGWGQFRVQIPSDWEIGKNGGGISFKSPSGSSFGISAGAGNPGSSKTAEELQDIILGDMVLISKDKITINELSGIRMVVKYNYNGLIRFGTYVAIDNGKIKNKDLAVAIIDYGDNSGNFLYKDQKTFDQILATFKFLDQK